MHTVPDFAPATPEIFLACVAMALLMVGAFRGETSARLVSWLSVLALVVGLFLLAVVPVNGTVTFSEMFISDRFAVFMKSLVLVGSVKTKISS